jgi:hypothetical protein
MNTLVGSIGEKLCFTQQQHKKKIPNHIHTHTHTHTHTKEDKLKTQDEKSSRDLEVGIDKYLQQVCNRNDNYEASTKKDNLTMATILKNSPQQKQKGCVCDTVAFLAIYMKKYLITGKRRRIMENSNISPCKNIIFPQCSKTNQNPSLYYNSTTNLKFQQHKPISLPW